MWLIQLLLFGTSWNAFLLLLLFDLELFLKILLTCGWLEPGYVEGFLYTMTLPI